MIREDIENVNFSELNELEQREYVTQLTLNIQKVVLQLMNSGDTALASLFSISTSLAMSSPPRLLDVLHYTAKQHEATQNELKINQGMQKLVDEQSKETKSTNDFPDLDSDKEQ